MKLTLSPSDIRFKTLVESFNLTNSQKANRASSMENAQPIKVWYNLDYVLNQVTFKNESEIIEDSKMLLDEFLEDLELDELY